MPYPSKPPHLWPVLAAGIAAVSGAAVLIKACQAPPIAIAFYRLAISSALLWPVFLFRGSTRQLCRTDVITACLSGVFLGLHFILWIYSLSYTSVASSVVFVTVNPLFVSLLGWLFLGEPVGRRLILAIGLVLAGGGIIAGRSASSLGTANLGNLLALGGALMGSCYLLAGRRARQRMDAVSYLSVCYTAAAALVLAVAVVFKTPLGGFGQKTGWLFLAIALGPQLIGHGSFNWGLKYLPISRVAMLIVLEPVGASVLAWLVLKQPPAAFEIAGGLLILAGVYVTVAGKAGQGD